MPNWDLTFIINGDTLLALNNEAADRLFTVEASLLDVDVSVEYDEYE